MRQILDVNYFIKENNMAEYVVSWDEDNKIVRSAINGCSIKDASRKFYEAFPERENRNIVYVGEGRPEEHARHEKSNVWY